MSRNLTFDRSWDISFAMDSSKNVRQKKKTEAICDFLDYLVTNVHNTSNNAGKKRNLIRGLCADIKDVSFSLDSKIFGENFEVLPLGIGKMLTGCRRIFYSARKEEMPIRHLMSL